MKNDCLPRMAIFALIPDCVSEICNLDNYNIYPKDMLISVGPRMPNLKHPRHEERKMWIYAFDKWDSEDHFTPRKKKTR